MYNSAYTKLQTWSQDATSMLTGTGTLFANKIVNDDYTMRKLYFEPMTLQQGYTIETVQHLCRTLADVVKCQCKDQLPEGKWNPSEELRQAAQANVPNNIYKW